MQKPFRLSVLALVISLSAMANDFDEGGSYGVSLGAVSSRVSSSNLGVDPSGRLGLRATIFWERPMGNQLSWQPEIGLVQKGYSFLTKSGVRLSYLEVPVFLKWRSATVNPQFFGFVGPSVGYLLGAVSSDETGTQSNIPRVRLNNIEFAVQGGIGLEVPVAPLWSMFAQVGYSIGVNSAFPSSVASVRNQVLHLAIGLTHATEDGIDNKEARAKAFLERRQGKPDESSVSSPEPLPTQNTPNPDDEIPAEPPQLLPE